MKRERIHLPLDPTCPDNPLPRLLNDPITRASGCEDELVEDLERLHRGKCPRCQEYGAANLEVES